MSTIQSRGGFDESKDSLEWNPEWDEEEEEEEEEEQDEEERLLLKDAAASQVADPELMSGSEKFFVNLTTTSNLMNLKGSLASILSAAGIRWAIYPVPLLRVAACTLCVCL
jgi:hypothetical protein